MPEVVIQQSYSRYTTHLKVGIVTVGASTLSSVALLPTPISWSLTVDASASQALRGFSNNPLQALAILNVRSFMKLPRVWLKGSGMILTSRQISNDSLGCLNEFGRAPSEKEADMILPLLAQLRPTRASTRSALCSSSRRFVGDGSGFERAAWVAVARLILNLDAFITRE